MFLATLSQKVGGSGLSIILGKYDMKRDYRSCVVT